MPHFEEIWFIPDLMDELAASSGGVKTGVGCCHLKQLLSQKHEFLQTLFFFKTLTLPVSPNMLILAGTNSAVFCAYDQS